MATPDTATPYACWRCMRRSVAIAGEQCRKCAHAERVRIDRQLADTRTTQTSERTHRKYRADLADADRPRNGKTPNHAPGWEDHPNNTTVYRWRSSYMKPGFYEDTSVSDDGVVIKSGEDFYLEQLADEWLANERERKAKPLED